MRRFLESLEHLAKNTVNEMSIALLTGASNLPTYLFAKLPWEIDYQDKQYWSAHFAEEIQSLKVQLPELRVGFLKKRLIELQCLIGKHTLSPIVYEAGVEELLVELSQLFLYSYQLSLIKLLTRFRTDLKNQSAFVQECFQGEMNDAIRGLINNGMPASDFVQLLLYYQALVAPKQFIAMLAWVESSLLSSKGLHRIKPEVYQELQLRLHSFRTDKKLGKILTDTDNAQPVIPRGLDNSNSMNQDRIIILEAKKQYHESKSLIENSMLLSKKILQFAFHYPLQALILGLMTQVVLANALGFARPNRKNRIDFHSSKNNSIFSDAYIKDGSLCNIYNSSFPISRNDLPGVCSAPNLAAIGNNRFVVAWVDDSIRVGLLPLKELSIKARIFDNDVRCLYEEFNVSSNNNTVLFPFVTSINDNYFAVIWQEVVNSSSRDLFGRVFYSNGTTNSDKFLINLNSSNVRYHSAISIGNNKIMVVWEGVGKSDHHQGIYGNILNFNKDNMIGSEFIVSPPDSMGPQAYPSITQLSENILVVWADYGQHRTSSAIKGQFFDSSGMHFKNIMHIVPDNNYINTRPVATKMRDGNNFILSWQRGQYDSPEGNVYALSHINDVWGSPFKVSNNSMSYIDFSPAIAGAKNGHFIIIWTAENNILYGQLFSSIYEPVGEVFLIDTNNNHMGAEPSAIITDDNHVIVTWSMISKQDGEYEVIGRIIELLVPLLHINSPLLTINKVDKGKGGSIWNIVWEIIVPTLASIGGIAVIGSIAIGGYILYKSKKSTPNPLPPPSPGDNHSRGDIEEGERERLLQRPGSRYSDPNNRARIQSLPTTSAEKTQSNQTRTMTPASTLAAVPAEGTEKVCEEGISITSTVPAGQGFASSAGTADLSASNLTLLQQLGTVGHTTSRAWQKDCNSNIQADKNKNLQPMEHASRFFDRRFSSPEPESRREAPTVAVFTDEGRKEEVGKTAFAASQRIVRFSQEAEHKVMPKAKARNEEQYALNADTKRETVYNENEIKKRLTEIVPNNFQLGRALSKGDCFFDACAQALNALSGKEEYDVKSLRLLCHEYVVELDKAWREGHSENWISKEFTYRDGQGQQVIDGDKYNQYLANIQYTAEEKEQGAGIGDEIAIWGESFIDGCIISQKLGVAIHILEIEQEEDLQFLAIRHQKVMGEKCTTVEEADINYQDPRLIHIVTFKDHYVPLLSTLLSAELSQIESTEEIPHINFPLTTSKTSAKQIEALIAKIIEPTLQATNQRLTGGAMKEPQVELPKIQLQQTAESTPLLIWIQSSTTRLTELQPLIAQFKTSCEIMGYQSIDEIDIIGFIENLNKDMAGLLKRCEDAKNEENNQFLFKALRDEWKLLRQDIQDKINQIETLKPERGKRVQTAIKTIIKFSKQLITCLYQEEVAGEQVKARLYDQLFTKALLEVKSLAASPSISCFISYVWGVKEHEQLAVRLAASLRGAGLQVYFDRTDNCNIGQHIGYFTDNIPRADYVVLIGSTNLKRKYEKGKALDKKREEERTAGKQVSKLTEKEQVSYVINQELDMISAKMLGDPGSTLILLLDGVKEECLPPAHWGMRVALKARDYRKEKAYCGYVFKLLASLLSVHKENIARKGKELKASLLDVKTRLKKGGDQQKLIAPLKAQKKTAQEDQRLTVNLKQVLSQSNKKQDLFNPDQSAIDILSLEIPLSELNETLAKIVVDKKVGDIKLLLNKGDELKLKGEFYPAICYYIAAHSIHLANGLEAEHGISIQKKIDTLASLIEAEQKYTNRGWNLLHKFAHCNNQIGCTYWLSQQVYLQKLNNFDQKRMTPLHLAAEEGHVTIVELLISAGADITKGSMGEVNALTPLHLAAKRGRNQVISILLKHPKIKNILNSKQGTFNSRESGFTPLHLAAKYGRFQEVEALINAGADQSIKNTLGETPLATAITSRDIIDFIDKDVISYHLLEGFNGELNNLNLFIKAISYGLKDTVKALYEKMKEIINSDCIMYCADAFKEIQKSEDALKEKYSAYCEVLQFLIEKGKDYNQNLKGFDTNTNTLHLACQLGFYEIVELLLNKKVEITKGWNGNSVFHLACLAKKNTDKIIQLLLQRCPHLLFEANNDLQTVLHFAVYYRCSSEVITILLRSGAQRIINHVDGNKKTALHLIAEADMHSQSKLVEYYTALVQLFLEHGADKKIEDSCGLDAMALASRAGNEELYDILSSRLDEPTALEVPNATDETQFIPKKSNQMPASSPILLTTTLQSKMTPNIELHLKEFKTVSFTQQSVTSASAKPSSLEPISTSSTNPLSLPNNDFPSSYYHESSLLDNELLEELESAAEELTSPYSPIPPDESDNLFSKVPGMSSSLTKRGMPHKAPSRWIHTLGDGNCAFNAVALGLCDLTLADQLIDNEELYNLLQPVLKLSAATKAAFKAWVNSHSNPYLKQRQLAPVLREWAVNMAEVHYLSCRDSYQELLWAAYQTYRRHLKAKTSSGSEEDLMAYDHIAQKFQVLAQEARQEEEAKVHLIEWWEAEGKTLYFQALQKPAAEGSDVSHWGSEIEIGMLAKTLKMNIIWEKHTVSYGSQQLGVGGGLIALDEISDSSVKQLVSYGVGDIYLNYFRLHAFSSINELQERLAPLSEEEIALVTRQLDLALKRGDRAFAATSEEIETMRSLLRKLQDKGIVTLVRGRYLFVSLDGKEQIDRERIECCLQALPEPLCHMLETSFIANVPQFKVRHAGNHWSYCPAIETSEKENPPIFVESYQGAGFFKTQGASGHSFSSLEQQSIETAIIEQVQQESIPTEELFNQFQFEEQQRFRLGGKGTEE